MKSPKRGSDFSKIKQSFRISGGQGAWTEAPKMGRQDTTLGHNINPGTNKGMGCSTGDYLGLNQPDLITGIPGIPSSKQTWFLCPMIFPAMPSPKPLSFWHGIEIR